MSAPWDYTLNVNLLEGADLHLDLLQEVMSQVTLEDDRALKQALFRYENYWLPLAAKHPSETLAAPLDVEWMWVCHMLSPTHYQRDCGMVAGRIISHKLYSPLERRKQQVKARALWGVEYPQEPFNLELEPGFYFTDDDIPSRLSADVIKTAMAQRIFYYQVSLPHYRDPDFLRASAERYRQFLFLQQLWPDARLAPCHDVDLMWHTHLLHPLAYKIDTETILGRTLPHNMQLCDPLSHPEVAEAFDDTRDLWQRTFESSFEVCGGMERGQPTAGRLHCMTPQQCFMVSTKTANFTIEKVEVQGLPRLKGKLVFKLYMGHDGKISRCFATLKGAPPWQGKALPSTELATKNVNYFKLRAMDQTGVMKCLGTRETVAERDIDLRPTLDSLTHETSVVHKVSMSQVHGAIPAQVTTHFCWPQRGTVHLYLRVGIFTPHPIPQGSPDTLWGPVPLPPCSSARLEQITCHVASHSLVNHSESVMMTCRVLHCPDLLLSAVHVLYQDKMAAVAHVVGLEQLPLPTQVSDPRRVPYLNPRTGERAVLIKNHAGDWAIVVGRWLTVKKGGSRIGSRRGRDLTGQLLIRVRAMGEAGWREVTLTYSEQQWTFIVADLVADLKHGTLRIDDPDCTDIAEKVALTFSVALLHVLCMPRPPGWRRAPSLRRSISRRGTRSSKWIPSDEMPFIIAAGILQDTPNNTFIRKAGISILGSAGGVSRVPLADMAGCRADHGLGGVWAHVTHGVTDLLAPPELEAERDSNASLQLNGNKLTVEGAWHHGSSDSAELSAGNRKTSGESSRSDDVTTHARKGRLEANESGEGGGQDKKKKKRRRLRGGTLKARLSKMLSSEGAEPATQDRKTGGRGPEGKVTEAKSTGSPKDRGLTSEGSDKRQVTREPSGLREDQPIITITSEDLHTQAHGKPPGTGGQLASGITVPGDDPTPDVERSEGEACQEQEQVAGTASDSMAHSDTARSGGRTERPQAASMEKYTQETCADDGPDRGTLDTSSFLSECRVPKAYSWDSGVLTEAATHLKQFDLAGFLAHRQTQQGQTEQTGDHHTTSVKDKTPDLVTHRQTDDAASSSHVKQPSADSSTLRTESCSPTAPPVHLNGGTEWVKETDCATEQQRQSEDKDPESPPKVSVRERCPADTETGQSISHSTGEGDNALGEDRAGHVSQSGGTSSPRGSCNTNIMAMGASRTLGEIHRTKVKEGQTADRAESSAESSTDREKDAATHKPRPSGGTDTDPEASDTALMTALLHSESVEEVTSSGQTDDEYVTLLLVKDPELAEDSDS